LLRGIEQAYTTIVQREAAVWIKTPRDGARRGSILPFREPLYDRYLLPLIINDDEINDMYDMPEIALDGMYAWAKS
jgi:hypothetical protein